MKARITENGTVTDAFTMADLGKQGFLLVPTFFSRTSSDILVDAYRDDGPGTCIVYRTDGQLPTTRRMQAPNRLSTITVHEIIFIEDCASNSATEADMQTSMILLTAGYGDNALPIRTEKTTQCNNITTTPPIANTNVSRHPRIKPHGGDHRHHCHRWSYACRSTVAAVVVVDDHKTHHLYLNPSMASTTAASAIHTAGEKLSSALSTTTFVTNATAAISAGSI
nr:unnamed protein product [Spirometra erinaceieuropaei]